MDIASVIGVVSGMGFILGTILLGGSIMMFVNIPSILIVVGGTMASAMVAYPLSDFLSIFKITMKIFIFKLQPPEEIISSLVEISNKARKGGLLSIEGDIQNTKDPYLAQALQMTVDGVKTADIAAIMQKKMALTKKKLDVGANIFGSMGAYAPAFGMIGTLIGLVQMLAGLDDPSTIGPKMAVAMITTFYGAIMANLFFIPMGDKLTGRNEEEITNMNIVFEGIISIREGEHPKLMEDKLNIYLGDGGKTKKETGE
ncbi:MAG: MotA/TolQ/ExbB proton channel family protein [Proteobacteria bacterium]|nr:MotA/TolQ/ExbB proton channel family protein [Pseudomonadota bacterium]MBU1389408.1 MotA/TolQ/ExbB proton channel family protein [Pseudomonadota bacterium]MBU1541228.1 MotA/TolQ/ExbB proton channel family protein [Pseudomonadota bacterium]MBU2430687.1 MotA/TolQ/ExbB proton channel family protein [Pseudomonadota bacterium]MBU2481040.1 MotA/TolQ/ExbB proton channel family protein [Pseudomonadota bacterium]